jgi:uncharacterized protein (DUF1330 family)
MLELVRVDPGEAQRFEAAFVVDALASAEAVGARAVWRAATDRVVQGLAADEWSQLALVEYPSRATYIDLVTSAEFRTLAETRDEIVGARASLAATPIAEFQPGGARAFVTRFLMKGDDEPADWWRESYAESVGVLERHDGAVVWQAALNPLFAEKQGAFDQVVVFGFPDEISRDAWLDDPGRSTLHTLQRRHLLRDVLLVVSPLG